MCKINTNNNSTLLPVVIKALENTRYRLSYDVNGRRNVDSITILLPPIPWFNLSLGYIGNFKSHSIFCTAKRFNREAFIYEAEITFIDD